MAMGLLPAHTEMSPRPDWVPAWDSLSADEQRLYARYMECFAAFLSHADAQIGRVLDFLEVTGDLDDTIVVLISDNGASSEGGPTGSVNDARPWNLAERTLEEALAKIDDIGGPLIHNNYPWGWTVAGNTPFRRWKREVHEGGVCDPMIVSWPRGLPADDAGAVRRQYVHAIDILPTLLDVAGIGFPDDDRRRRTGTARRRVVPIDAHVGRRGRDPHDAVLRDVRVPGDLPRRMEGRDVRVDDGRRHRLRRRHRGSCSTSSPIPSECHDRAADEPERLADLIGRWWGEAEANGVLPIDSMPFFEAMERTEADTVEGSLRVLPRHRAGGGGRGGERARPGSRHHRHRGHPRWWRRRGPGLAGLGPGRVRRCTWPTVGCAYAHNFVSLETSAVSSASALPAGRHTRRHAVRQGRRPVDRGNGDAGDRRGRRWLGRRSPLHADPVVDQR